jgi:glycosyltransferase involved in cell wall biosynthesis
MKRDVCSKGIMADKITPVPMGVNLDDYFEFVENYPMSDKDKNPSVLYIGDMGKIRRIDFVLRVFNKVHKEVPAAKLYMVGGSSNPKDIELLKIEAKALKIYESTFFTGILPRMQALEYVNMATVCVSPIFPNPIFIPSSPTKIIEYMLMGKPVVANDIPDQLKIIKESKAGYCVNYNEDAFAKAILTLIRDPEGAKKMGRRGQLYVKQKRNYEKIANIVEKQYFKFVF